MTLNSLGAAPSLDVMNVDAMSHSAPSGTRLDGASSMNEVQMIITARGPGSFAQALGNAANFTQSSAPPPSPATVQMTQMLAQISQQTLRERGGNRAADSGSRWSRRNARRSASNGN